MHEEGYWKICKTFILVTQKAEKLGVKHLLIFFETPCTKMGEQEYAEYKENLELEKREEGLLDKKTREMRKNMNKARLHPKKEK